MPSEFFIGGLNLSTSEEALSEAFNAFGTVDRCSIRRNPATGISRGFGFITLREDVYLSTGIVELDGRVVEIREYDETRSGRGVGGGGGGGGGGRSTSHLTSSPRLPPLAASKDVVWVDDTERLRVACDSLRGSTRLSGFLAIDCHGVLLGRKGRICTLQLCGGDSVVYMVDMEKLGTKALDTHPRTPGQALRGLLEDATLPKLFFDCRADLNALFYHFGISIPPSTIVDLQVLDIAVAVRTGRPMRHLSSLGAVLGHCPLIPPGVRSRCSEVREAALGMFAVDRGGSYANWSQRPLAPLLVEHACEIRHYHTLVKHLQASISAAGGGGGGGGGRGGGEGATSFSPHPRALAAAVERRVAAALSLEFDVSNRSNGDLDREVVGWLKGMGAPPPPPAPSPSPPTNPGGGEGGAGGTPKGEGECVVCLDAKTTHAFMACGHMCVCQGCAENLSSGRGPALCPTCRTPSEKIMKIFR